ncbi:MAG: DUF1688 family protein, partial [Acetobacteraceae bacterium]|nr:DUF1688 family protein [Acetobacteraceae bacterium]
MSQEAAYTLLTPEAVRERSHELLRLGLAGQLGDWIVDPDRLPAAADLVAEVVRANYPSLDIPFHARWQHFAVGGRDRWDTLRREARFPDAAAAARAAFDLVILSVLLDAGAGPDWRYREAATGAVLARSEGLAVASLDAFATGGFAADGASPRADAARLGRITAAELARMMQAGPGNPLVGLEGRAALLRRLGETVAAAPRIFARRDGPRPGGLF